MLRDEDNTVPRGLLLFRTFFTVVASYVGLRSYMCSYFTPATGHPATYNVYVDEWMDSIIEPKP